MIESSLKKIFVFVFDIFIVILAIVAIVRGPGGYTDFVEKRELADCGLAAVEIVELTRKELENQGVIEEETIDSLTLQNPLPFRSGDYGWMINFFGFSGDQRLELGRVGSESVGKEHTIHTFAVAVVHENTPIPGQLEVSVWRA